MGEALWENKASDPLLVCRLLELGLIAVNTADGVQWHQREGFMEVKAGLTEGIDGRKDGGVD